MMLYLMRAQLFMDGNKRVAQLAANQMLIQDGVGILNIPVDKQLHFFDLLIEFYETNHAEELKAFLKKYAIEELPEMDAVREQEDITLE